MFETYYKNKFISLEKKILELNKRNVKGYNTFTEYVDSDIQMRRYYKDIISISKKLPYAQVDSEDIFNINVNNQLIKIYSNFIYRFLDINNEEESKSQLIYFVGELKNNLGKGFDDIINSLINETENIIKNFADYHKSQKQDKKVIISSIEELTQTNENFDNYKSSENAKYDDPLYNEILEFAIRTGKISASLIQRKYNLGYNRAARIIDIFEERGIISSANGSKPRTVLVKLSDDGYEYNNSSTLSIKDVIKPRNKLEITNSKYDSNIIEELSSMISNLLNIKTNYENDGEILSGIDNFIFPNADESDIIHFINNVIRLNTPHTLKLVMIDYSKLIFNIYEGIPHLLLPIFKDENKISRTIMKLKDEMDNRYNLFVETRTKNINSYNEMAETTNKEKMPKIFIIVDEAYNLINDSKLNEAIIQLLLNGAQAGIQFAMFSKFSQKNLYLGVKLDLLKVYNRRLINKLFELTESNDEKIDLEHVDSKMIGLDFEKYTKKLLLANDFSDITITQASNDFGVDVIAYKDDIKYAIQCKKYNNPVGISAIQEVVASKAMHDCHVAVVLTNSYFTKSASDLAHKNGVLLWDRKKLQEFINILNNKG